MIQFICFPIGHLLHHRILLDSGENLRRFPTRPDPCILHPIAQALEQLPTRPLKRFEDAPVQEGLSRRLFAVYPPPFSNGGFRYEFLNLVKNVALLANSIFGSEKVGLFEQRPATVSQSSCGTP
jgi:hypothetical protein